MVGTTKTGNVVSDGLVVDGNSDLNGDLDVDGHTDLEYQLLVLNKFNFRLLQELVVN